MLRDDEIPAPVPPAAAVKALLVAGLGAFVVSLFLPVVTVSWGGTPEVGYGVGCFVMSVIAIPAMVLATLVPGLEPSWSYNMLVRLGPLLGVCPGLSAILGILSPLMCRFPRHRSVRILNRLHCVLAAGLLAPIAFARGLSLHVGYVVWAVAMVLLAAAVFLARLWAPAADGPNPEIPFPSGSFFSTGR
ncbi:MAG TPA: hypothetical protein VMS22_00010 [Candidatus Eisenbacteria bacterium]|nr:hypothetical protein [Candidatus Eisenbacteria bacterium]